MTLSEQFYSMIAMGGMGIFLGASLTTYHRFLPSKKLWRWLVFISDLLFWSLQGLIIFYVLLLVNQGTLRFYLFLALGIGFTAYKGLFETTYYKILDGLIRFSVGTYRFLKNFVKLFFVQPLLTLLKLSYALVKMISRVLLGILLFIGTALWAVIRTLIYKPLKWLFLVLIPTSWIQKIGSFMMKSQVFFSNIKAFVGKFFRKWR